MDVSNSYFLISFILGLVLAVLYLYWLNRLNDVQFKQAASAGLMIAAFIYIGFAWFYGERQWLIVELLGVGVYGTAALLALRYSVLWLAVGWGLHPIWDLWVHWLGPGTHIVPAWYAIACLSFDLLVAGYIVMRSDMKSLLIRGQRESPRVSK